MEAEAEASKKRAQEQQEAKKRQLEDDVDNLFADLPGVASLAPPPETSRKSSRADEERARDRDRDRDRGGRRGGGLSRSRSIQRPRSKSRRRRRDASPKVDFAEALKRRMQQRDATDTSRMPVVDPGHAARWASRTGY